MMERALKERIIGAAVLVLFVVLVVPVFLDGPPDDGEIVSEPVLLPGQEAQKTQTVVLDRDRTEPVPAAANNASAETPEEAPAETQPRTTPQPLRSEPAPVAQQAAEEPEVEQEAPEPVVSKPVAAPPSATSSTGMWAVQLGSFSNKENAEKLAADLRRQGYAAFLSQLQTPRGPLHRVRIGPQKDRESAEAMARRLEKVDHKGQVVPHP